MTVSALRALLATLPPTMEVGVESSEDDGDNLGGHSIYGAYTMDFTTPTGGSEVFLLQVDRDDDCTARWTTDRAPTEGPDNRREEEL